MELTFYLSSFISLISIFFIIIGNSLFFSILFLIISFLSTSSIFFLLGSYLIGSFQVIIYSGAILLLFVFVIMMTNYKNRSFFINFSLKKILSLFMYIFLCAFFLIEIVYTALFCFNNKSVNIIIFTKDVGKVLFSNYFFVIELSSMLLLISLILSFYLNKNYKDL
ncbi:NADH-quinone oxidoreductase subunit J [Buchnera aphidicola (Ceratoglyphina bambusae)]|uniref:NADH-quinone oxidoreductase subunit J family protein n=1 Tax=Buchnera aphidicola TaxID=9 RepID=UPI0031B7FFBB